MVCFRSSWHTEFKVSISGASSDVYILHLEAEHIEQTCVPIMNEGPLTSGVNLSAN